MFLFTLHEGTEQCLELVVPLAVSVTRVTVSRTHSKLNFLAK